MDNEESSLRSPLAGLEGDETLAMEERIDVGKIVFRGNPDEKVRGAFSAATGVSLPLKPNTTQQGDGALALWLGPNEWMVHCPLKGVPPIREKLDKETAGLHVAHVDVSDYYTVIRIGGNHAREALAQGCPLDLHSSKFGAGDCAQSRFDAATILLHQADDKPTYDIQVRWSFARHVWILLGLAAKELREQ